MRRRGTIAALAGAVLAMGVGTADAALLPDLTDATRAELKKAAPDLTNRQLKRAIVAAAESGAKPRKLRKPSPAWYDRKAQRRQDRDSNNDDGVTTAPVDAPIPPYVGIRPGAMMISPFICTMNYIFQKGGTLAIGTAGHCIEGGEPVDLLAVAPDGGGDPVPVLVRLGKVLLKRDGGIGHDYALVEIPPHLHSWVFPTQAVIGGPCGVYTADDPLPLAHYGHGIGIGTGGTPRAGMGFELEGGLPIIKIRGIGKDDWVWDSDSIVWAGLINGGDSGSGVRVGTMPAVSNLTHGIGITGLEPSAIAWGTRVQTITNSGWTLVNSMFCPPAG
jgi:hypothetical protein